MSVRSLTVREGNFDLEVFSYQGSPCLRAGF